MVLISKADGAALGSTVSASSCCEGAADPALPAITDGARYGRMPQGRIRIGISGWRYAPWRGKFYPKGLRQADELAYAAEKFSTIEINGTFYSLQRPEFFKAWRGAAPEGFVFARLSTPWR
jgi:hypothetical protein